MWYHVLKVKNKGDKMQVELLSRTENAEALIYSAFKQCYSTKSSAEVFHSTSKENSNKEISKFITDLIESGHTSPVEHVSFSFGVSGVSRALTHQLVRHRIASYSQQSQRYVNSFDFEYITPVAIKKDMLMNIKYQALMKDISNLYHTMLKDAKIDAEDARYMLPNSTTTKIVITMNCRALLNFFEHRCCTRAQWEIRSLANKMLNICKSELPAVFQKSGAICFKTKECPEPPKLTCGLFPLKERK